ALLEVAGLGGKTIDSGHFAFLLAPRVNAAGRLASPEIASRPLLSGDETMAAEAHEPARQLDGENVRRPEAEGGILSRAKTGRRVDDGRLERDGLSRGHRRLCR